MDYQRYPIEYRVPELNTRWRIYAKAMIGCSFILILAMFLPMFYETTGEMSLFELFRSTTARDWQRHRWFILFIAIVPISFFVMLGFSTLAYQQKRLTWAIWNIVLSVFDFGVLGLITLALHFVAKPGESLGIGIWLMLAGSFVMIIVSWRFLRHIKNGR